MVGLGFVTVLLRPSLLSLFAVGRLFLRIPRLDAVRRSGSRAVGHGGALDRFERDPPRRPRVWFRRLTADAGKGGRVEASIVSRLETRVVRGA